LLSNIIITVVVKQ